MDGYRTDALADFGYGILFVVAIGLMVVAGIQTGITFGLGVFLAYAIHVGWKMSRLDPQWMTTEVVEAVEEAVTEKVTKEVSESVEKQVGESVAESMDKEMGETVRKSVESEVAESVDKTVAETVEKTVSNEVSQIAEKVDEVNERVERRPRKDEVSETIDKTKEELEEAIDETKEKRETDDGRMKPDSNVPASSET